MDQIAPQPREVTESARRVPRLRYLPVTDFWSHHHSSYPLVSIDKIMAARGLVAARSPPRPDRGSRLPGCWQSCVSR